MHYPIALLDNQCIFISALSNELFVYEGGQIMPGYYVNIPENEPSEDFIEEHKDLNFFELIETLKKSNIGWGITAVESSSDYLFMSISNKSTLIWDKKRSIQISNIYDPNLKLYSDLLLPGGVSDEHLGFYSADFLYANKELILKGNDRFLAKLVGNLLEDDNPVVYQYYFKKNASIPSFMLITPAKMHDVNATDWLHYESGSFYIFDRGYVDFSRLYRIDQSEAWFVILGYNDECC